MHGDVRESLGVGFWWLWSSSSLSNLADGVFKVALPLVALSFTRSPALVAGVTTALTLPWLVCALPVGALVDRLDRRQVMLVANLVRTVIFGLLATMVAVDVGSIWLLYVAAVLAGVTETFYDTASLSILPQVVHRDQLSRANSRLFAAQMVANEFVGPPLGGLLVAAGAGLAFATPAGLWVLAAGLLLLLPGRFRVARKGSSTIRADIAEGIRLLWRNRVLRSIAVMTGVFNLASSASVAVLVLYAVGDSSALGLTEAQYGLLFSITAAGSVLGTLAVSGVERRLGRSRTLALGLVLAALFVGIPGLTTEPLVVAVGFFLGGVGLILWNVVAVSLRQRVTPDALLGRITSVHRLFAWGSMPLGAVLGGAIGEWLGVRAVFGIMAVLVLGLLALMRNFGEDILAAAEQDS